MASVDVKQRFGYVNKKKAFLLIPLGGDAMSKGEPSPLGVGQVPCTRVWAPERDNGRDKVPFEIAGSSGVKSASWMQVNVYLCALLFKGWELGWKHIHYSLS